MGAQTLQPVILIPARLAATRLPNKPLAMIAGEPMIVHVWRRAVESGVGPVVVACDGEEIASVIRAAGGEAVITDPNHPSGSDRIFEALQKIDPPRDIGRGQQAERAVSPRSGVPCEIQENSAEQRYKHNIVVNLQGDIPTIDPRIIAQVLAPLHQLNTDIATLVCEIAHPAERDDPAVVKPVVSWNEEQRLGRALYFTRFPAPYGEGALYHHIGIYAYRREALARFVSLPPSPLEKREKLEQLRALEAGMSIGVARVDTVPLGVDTEEHLERARVILGGI